MAIGGRRWYEWLAPPHFPKGLGLEVRVRVRVGAVAMALWLWQPLAMAGHNLWHRPKNHCMTVRERHDQRENGLKIYGLYNRRKTSHVAFCQTIQLSIVFHVL